MTMVVEDTVDDSVVKGTFQFDQALPVISSLYLAVQRRKQLGIDSVMEFLSNEQEARLDRYGVTTSKRFRQHNAQDAKWSF